MTRRRRFSRIGIAALLALAFVAAAGAAPASKGDKPEARLEKFRSIDGSRHPPAPAEASRILTEIGAQFLEEGDSGRAIELLEESVARNPENGDALAWLTLAYMRNGDFDFAAFYLDQALHSSAQVEEAEPVWEEIGNLSAQRGRLDDALEAWEQARRLKGSDPVLEAKIARTRREWAYGHGQEFYAGREFEFYFDPSIELAAVESIDRYLEQNAASLAEFFMVPLKTPQVVILYRDRSYLRLLDTPDWVAGFFDGKIHVPLDNAGGTSEIFLALLSHELAHAFLQEIGAYRAPAWLQEGLAQFVEGRRVDRSMAAGMVPREGSWIFDSDGDFHQRVDRERARKAYVLSLSFLQFLVRRFGSASLVCLVRDLGGGDTLAAASLKNLGADVFKVESEWLSTLRRP
ncbi:MAG: tetratricopeptide repeat protein [Thermoanaerobaculia bacterium]